MKQSNLTHFSDKLRSLLSRSAIGLMKIPGEWFPFTRWLTDLPIRAIEGVATLWTCGVMRNCPTAEEELKKLRDVVNADPVMAQWPTVHIVVVQDDRAITTQIPLPPSLMRRFGLDEGQVLYGDEGLRVLRDAHNWTIANPDSEEAKRVRLLMLP